MFTYGILNLPNRLRGFKQELLNYGSLGLIAQLKAKKIFADGRYQDFGIISRRLVTNAGVAFLVDAFQNLTEIEDFKFHASGTSGTAENVTDTALGVEVATRATGSQTEGAANEYVTVGTIPYTATLSIVEHGIFSAGAGGTLWDRSVFAAINVVNLDSIQFTYTLTVNAGG